MSVRRFGTMPLRIGLIAGLLCGVVDLLLTWFFPLGDDTPWALLPFYGSMFFIWAVVAFRVARRTGRFGSGVLAGIAVAFATFAVFIVLNFVRVNLFLDQLTARLDWRNMVVRFQASGSDNLRLFINLDYLKGTPLKIAVASAVGGVMGVIGGSLGRLTRGIRVGTT